MPFKITIEQDTRSDVPRFEWVLLSVYKRALEHGTASTREQAYKDADAAWNKHMEIYNHRSMTIDAFRS